MQQESLFSVFLLLLAPCVGSFLCLLVDRLPRGEDVVRRRSYCRSCGQALGIWDLVPIVSFVLSRGRCRQCGAAVPPWVLYGELAALGLAVLALSAGGSVIHIGLTALMLWTLLGLFLSDLLWWRLPDPLTAALALWAGGLAALPGGIGLEAALWGAICGAGSFWALRWGYARVRGREGLGLGDVKLMVGLGAFAGPWDLPILVLLAAGSLLALTGIAARFGQVEAGRPLGQLAVPFGAALCLSCVVLWWLRAMMVL